MDEQEFDALFSARSFGMQDAIREDARWRRRATLAMLFGSLRCTIDYLETAENFVVVSFFAQR